MPSPHGGPQPEVQFCPACGSKVTPIRSLKKPAASSHTYLCSSCSRRFEINELGMPSTKQLPRAVGVVGKRTLRGDVVKKRF